MSSVDCESSQATWSFGETSTQTSRWNNVDNIQYTSGVCTTDVKLQDKQNILWHMCRVVKGSVHQYYKTIYLPSDLSLAWLCLWRSEQRWEKFYDLYLSKSSNTTVQKYSITTASFCSRSAGRPISEQNAWLNFSFCINIDMTLVLQREMTLPSRL